MPRIAATLLTVTIMAVAIGVNIYRYPVVTEMVSGTITRDQSESIGGREPLLTIPEQSEPLGAEELASDAWDETVDSSSDAGASPNAAANTMTANDVADSAMDSAAVETLDAGASDDHALRTMPAEKQPTADRYSNDRHTNDRYAAPKKDDRYGDELRASENPASSSSLATGDRYGDFPDRRIAATPVAGASFERTDELLTTRPLVPVVVPERYASEQREVTEDEVRRLPSTEGSTPLVVSDTEFRLPDGSIPFYPSTGGPE